MQLMLDLQVEMGKKPNKSAPCMYNLNQIIYYIVCGELETITTPYIYLKIRRHIYSSEVLVLLFLLGFLLAVCYPINIQNGDHVS